MNDETKIIVLNRRGKPPLECLVDASDYEWLTSIGCWRPNISTRSYPYAARFDMKNLMPNGRPRLILMHRLIIGAGNGQLVDHANRNTLDNRRCNLRLATRSQNSANSFSSNQSGYRGVFARSNRFFARIVCQSKSWHLGTFDTAEEAARQFDQKARQLHGEFAVLNFPNDYAKAGAA